MNVIKIYKDKAILEFSKEELGVLGNTLNEVCNGIEVWEFDTRMGITIENAKILLENLTLIYEEINQESSKDIEE